MQKAAVPADPVALAQVIPIFEEVHLNQAHLCMIQFQGELDNDVVDECAIPNYKGPAEFDIPECVVPQLEKHSQRIQGYILCYTRQDQ